MRVLSKDRNTGDKRLRTLWLNHGTNIENTKKKRGKVKKITKESTARTHLKDALKKGIMRPQAICQQTEIA